MVELEEMGGEEGGDEGDPGAEAFRGNQEAEVLEGNHVAGEAGIDQSVKEAGGEQEAVSNCYHSHFPPDSAAFDPYMILMMLSLDEFC